MLAKLVLLFVVLVNVCSFTFAEDEAVLSMYIDPDCREQARTSIRTELPFSNECQVLPSDAGKPLRSAVLDCVQDSRGLVMFTYMVYNNTDACADFNGGNLDFGVETYGPYQSCMKTNVLENNRFTPLYSRVECRTGDEQPQLQKLKLTNAYFGQGAPVKPVNAVLKRNKEMKKKLKAKNH